jgi:transcription elongation factor GreA
MSDELNRAREIVVGEGVAPRVAIGTRVTVVEDTTGKRSIYTILGPWDVDAAGGTISYMSPLGAGLIGKQCGDAVQVTLPSGQTTVTVHEIEWATPADAR